MAKAHDAEELVLIEITEAEKLEPIEDVEAEAEAQEAAQVETKIDRSSTDVVTNSFTELRLAKQLAQDIQDGWNSYINSAVSREAAGEAYGLLV